MKQIIDALLYDTDAATWIVANPGIVGGREALYKTPGGRFFTTWGESEFRLVDQKKAIFLATRWGLDPDKVIKQIGGVENA